MLFHIRKPIQFQWFEAGLLLACALFMPACGTSSGANSDGAALFVKSFGAAGNDVIHDVTETPDGGYCFVGAFGGTGLQDPSHRFDNEDMWITKVDALGNVEWSQTLANSTPTNFEDPGVNGHPVMVEPGSLGGYFVGSQYSERPTNSPVDWSDNVSMEGVDAAGDRTWIFNYSVPAPFGMQYVNGSVGGRDSVTSMAGTADNGVIVAGTTVGPFSVSGRLVQAQFGWVLKIDSTGALAWIHHLPLDLSSGRDYGSVLVTVAPDGSIYAGQYSSQAGAWSFSGRRGQRSDLFKLTETGLRTWSERVDDFDVEGISIATSAGGSHGPLMIGYDIDTGDDWGTAQACLYDSDGNREFHIDLNLDRIDAGAGVMPDGADPGAFQFMGVSSDWDPDSPSERHTALRLIETDGAGQLRSGTESMVEGISQAYDARITGLLGSPRFEFLCGRPRPFGSLQDLPGVVVSGLVNGNAASPIDSEVDLGFELSERRGSPLTNLYLAGWGQGTDTIWSWVAPDDIPFPFGRLLLHRDSVGDEIWSRSFQAGNQRQAERALEVEVMAHAANPEEWKLAIYGQSDMNLGISAGEEVTYPWLLTVSPEGSVLSETLFDNASLGLLEAGRSSYDNGYYFSELNRGGWLKADDVGNAFLVIEIDYRPHVAKLDGSGAVLWTSAPLVVNADSGVYGVIALQDGGAMAVVGSVLIRMDSAGQILWRKFFADQDPIGWAQGEDGNLGVLTWESELAVETLDLHGNRLWRCAWSIDGERLKLHGARLAAAKGDGFVVLMGRQLPTDLTASLSQPSEMLELFKVNGDGTPEWRSTIGGLLDEFGFGLEVMGDGGLLVGGSSQSITDSTDGWLLRLDSCGQAGPNCVAEFEHREAGFSFVLTPMGAGAPLEDYAFPAAFETQGVLSSLGASAFQIPRTDMLITRQCSAVSKDEPVLPAATYVDLNVIIQSGEGIVDQVGGDGQGFPCTSSCSYSFPVGTTVQLSATPLAGFLDPSWTGGDCGPGNSASCSITMDGSRTVFLDFPPEGTYQGLLDLNVIIQGPGSGQVLISPPNFSISDSFLFEDLSAEGDSHVITATPDAGSTFAGFTGCDSVDGFEGFITFGTTDRTVTVTFQ